MTFSAGDLELRRARVQPYAGRLEFRPTGAIDTDSSLVGITSSRLGHDINLHRRVCQFLSRALMEARDAKSTLLVAEGSAIEPWVVRGAALFGVPLVRMRIRESDSGDLSRDAVLIDVADRVDAMHVLRGGKVEQCLRDRLAKLRDASTRVAIHGDKKCAAAGLIADGAIGWYLASNKCSTAASPAHTTVAPDSVDADWTRSDGNWLVHCTRGREGPWPGESDDQYRDAILVDHPCATSRAPIDALERIVRSRCLIASSVATLRSDPVVCFTALPLAQVLTKRCFRPHLGRWDYEPFGVAIRTSAAKQVGIEGVIYGQPADRRALAREDRYRFHPVGKTFNWQVEREWRSRRTIDLNEFAIEDVRVFAPDSFRGQGKLANCPWQIAWLTS